MANLLIFSKGCLNENKINHPDNRYLAVLPLNHIYGLLCLLYAPMLTGSHIMYLEELSSEEQTKLEAEQNATESETGSDNAN